MPLLTILAIILFNISFAQNSDRYYKLTEKAKKFYEKGKYLKSGQTYSEAFIISVSDPASFMDRYYATKSWVRANKIDSAFVQLFIFGDKIFAEETIHNAAILDIFRVYDFILADTNLTTLHADQRWEDFIEITERNKAKVEAGLDMQLVMLLEPIFDEDQSTRHQAMEAELEYGQESEEWQLAFKIMRDNDSIHLVKVEDILNERGWLGPQVIGHNGNLCLWLVIHHSNLEKWEKYTPMMRDAVEKGNARSDQLALLEDRLALAQGRKQIYGSQLDTDPKTGKSYVKPLEDPDNVDIRRAAVGLNSLQEYLSEYGMKWNAKRYKKKLPKIEEKDKKYNVHK